MRRDGDEQIERATASGPVAGPGHSRPFTVSHREVWAITLPMTLAFLTTPLIGLTDTAIVGRVGDATALGGLVVGALIFDFAFATCNFLRSGTTGLTAQAVGEANGCEVQAVFWRAMVLALGIGLLLILAEPLVTSLGLLAIAPGPGVADTTRLYVFLRMFSAPFALANYAILGHVLGRGRGGLGLALQIVVNGTNIALSILFGLVMEYGIAGVAVGTVCGEAVGALVGFAVVARGFDRAERPSPARVFERRGIARMIAVNRDIMIRTFCLLGAFVLFTRLGARTGALTLAANGILMNFFLVGGYFLDGMATASEQLVGRSVGARFRPAFDRAVKLTLAWGLGLSLALSALFLISGEALIAVLTTDLTVRAAAGDYLFWAALTPLAGALAFIMDGIFIGATWSRTMRDMMIASFVIFAISAYALSPVFGNDGLWAALLVFLGFRGVSLMALLPRRRAETFGTAAT
ncbi:MATE family efflux transporter [Aurantimonas marianensis]|uniref:MATE family efflux transporter n=1 Tax=Aurantimonas marianensis TaxID=2920428 RepID=A0A9X2KDE4_9HYPH|nr:MATE family efflux transporter [Aurantimonas marianensis]MCP3053559.1 MATE family efflux transporter [Aurantimonas marianensis]